MLRFPARTQSPETLCAIAQKIRLEILNFNSSKIWKIWRWNLTKIILKKNSAEKYFSQNKVEKINAWKICSWKSSNWKNLLFIIEKNRTKLFKKQPKIFFRKWKWRSFDKFSWKYLKKLLKNGKLRCTQHYIGKMRAWILRWICKIYFRRCFSYYFFV